MVQLVAACQFDRNGEANDEHSVVPLRDFTGERIWQNSITVALGSGRSAA
jgi:hypothetical protein